MTMIEFTSPFAGLRARWHGGHIQPLAVAAGLLQTLQQAAMPRMRPWPCPRR